MEVSASQLFWKLVEEKAGIAPATKPATFTKQFVPKEAAWQRFKTVLGQFPPLPTALTISSSSHNLPQPHVDEEPKDPFHPPAPLARRHSQSKTTPPAQTCDNPTA